MFLVHPSVINSFKIIKLFQDIGDSYSQRSGKTSIDLNASLSLNNDHVNPKCKRKRLVQGRSTSTEFTI